MFIALAVCIPESTHANIKTFQYNSKTRNVVPQQQNVSEGNFTAGGKFKFCSTGGSSSSSPLLCVIQPETIAFLTKRKSTLRGISRAAIDQASKISTTGKLNNKCDKKGTEIVEGNVFSHQSYLH